MRIGLLTDGGYPYVSGEARLWCDRLVRGLERHAFEVYALSRSAQQEEQGWVRLPEQVHRVRTAALWDAPEDEIRLGRRARRVFLRHFEALATAVCSAEGARAGAGAGGRGRAGEREGAVARAGGSVRPGSSLTGTGARQPGARPSRRGARRPRARSSGTAPGAGASGGLAGLTALAGLTTSVHARGGPGADAEGYRAGAAPGHSTEAHADRFPEARPDRFPEARADRFPEVRAGGAGHPGGSFAEALYGLAELAQETGGLAAALRSEPAVRVLERACRAAGALPAARRARVSDLLLLTDLLERALRPLSLDWYAEDSLGSVDLCHATAGGLAALPGLLAHHFRAVPLLVTEYGVRLRALYLEGTAPADGPGGGSDPAALSAPVRAVLGGFHRELAAETYRVAALVTPGNAHARRWQERCGADPAKLRTVYPGMDASRFTGVGEEAAAPTRAVPTDGPSRSGWDLVWVGRIEPAKDLATLLRAFVTVHQAEPRATLRIVGPPPADAHEAGHRASCERLAAELFPAHRSPRGPVYFEDAAPEGSAGPSLAEIYAAADAVVLSSVVEGFPISLVEAMFCARATVSTDVGAVVEVVGGTGLVVPPRDPEALAGACLDLLRDPARRAVLGSAARSRALELFTVEQNIAAFREIYLDIVSRCPVPHEAFDAQGEPLPFGRPAETLLPLPHAGAGAAPARGTREPRASAPGRRMEAAR